MAQNRNKAAKRARSYSADAMLVRMVGGLLLIALGVMIFLAVVLSMAGDVFAGMRQICHGLAGGLAFLLPVLPIWGGVLVIVSIQRKPRLRPLALFALLLILVLTAANLFSYSGSPAVPLMQYFHTINQSRSATPAAFDLFLARAYEMGARSGMGGGLLGMLLAWPLWQLAGVLPAAIITCLLAVGDFLLLIQLDFKKLFGRVRARQDQRHARQEEQQQLQRAQELEWQRRQQEQAALAWAQQGTPQPNAGGWEDYVPQGAYTQPTVSAQPVQQLPLQQQRQMRQAAPAPRQAVAATSGPVGFQAPAPEQGAFHPAYQVPPEEAERKSKIFGRKKPAPEPVLEPGAAEAAPRKSRIFGGRKAEAPQQPVYEDPIPVPEQENMPAAMPQEAPAPQRPVQEPPASRPARIQHMDEGWEDAPAAPAATWRGGNTETDFAPRPARKAEKTKQQPQPSWSETPPWEDAPAAPAPAVPAPRLQQEPPRDSWKPDLKLPPRKNPPQGEQVEMELPPPYVYPGMNLLKLPEPQAGISEEEDAMRSQRLEETLQSFKVPAKVRHVTHGPAISRFELELAAGIKVTKVTDLGKNIAMNMEVKSVRIEAPIPGKALVGVEVPNRKVSTVTLREVLESQPMREAKSPLVVALGKDIAGTPIVCDLARMPHLLIAGATGSGKSVCINTMINSLLYRCSPQEVRLILVDPKVVELQCYNGIPHLLIPVVSDPHKASGALAWAVAEMMDRYKKFEQKAVRAIDGYNAKLEDGEEFMPRIVIIIDELADLMMTCKRDVEEHICRLAQLARAAGIHLVVATQRPSVDVITGLIKANIPSRIAFKVSSFIDSRTILDRVGAEQLLGWGDMLYLPTGEFTPIRVQGCFMSDGEVNRVTDFIREHSEADYDPNVMEQLDALQREADGSFPTADTVESSDDPNSDSSLLAQCIEMAVNDGQVSTSLLQRRLKVGYARAGRLVDEMEKRGVVSAKDGAKPRMCLISREEFERMKENNELDE